MEKIIKQLNEIGTSYKNKIIDFKNLLNTMEKRREI